MIEAKLDHKQMVYSVTDGNTVLCDVRNVVAVEYMGTFRQYSHTDGDATRKRAEHIAEALRHYQQSQEAEVTP